MSHLGQDTMRRILGGEGRFQEVERATEHLLSCDGCRARAGTLLDELRSSRPGLLEGGALQLVFDLIDRERQWGVDSLAAIAEWSEVRRLPGRRSQRDRVRMTKACHTVAFFNLVLDELKEQSSWDEAEFLAGLALLSAEAMSQREQITQAFYHDLQAEVWTAVANARRLAAEWTRSHQALTIAERCWKQGTGDLRLKAGLLSIKASTLTDEGHDSQALEALETCKSIYEGLSEQALVARTLVKKANLLVESDPSTCLAALDQAEPLIPAEDSYLKLLAELLRVRGLTELGRLTEALQAYRCCSRLLSAGPRVRLRIRGRWIGARLLEALGYKRQAERLYTEVVDQDIEHELYKDAFLDFLYLYEFHVKAGSLEKAARICQRALTDATLAAVAHEQLQSLWSQLLEVAQREAISQELLRDLRQYVNVHWKHPAVTPPRVGGR